MKTSPRAIASVAVACISPALAFCGGTNEDSNADAGGIRPIDPGTNTISGTSGSSGSVSVDAACVASVQEGEAIPVNLLFLVDRSGSMTCPLGPAGQTCGVGNNQAPVTGAPPDRWSAVTDALRAFVNAPSSAGVGVALQFFPLAAGGGFGIGLGGIGGAFNAACNVAAYETPATQLDVLPPAAAHFTMVLDSAGPQGNTPTTPALQGAIALSKNQEMADPSRETSVVLTSDGIPNGCGSTVANAAAAVSAGFTGSPSVKTYVVGVGPELGSLNQIAAAGGTKAAFLVDTGTSAAQVAADLAAALRAIAAPIRCDYAIPKTSGKALDFGAVNVEVQVGPQGPPMLLGQVRDLGACGASGGWYYDNPSMPGKISLCPASCQPLLDTMGSRLQILIGCATQMAGVR